MKWIKANEEKPDRQVCSKDKDGHYGILVPWFGDTYYFITTDFTNQEGRNVTNELENYLWLDESPSSEVKEQQGENELRNIAEYYFHNHKQTFKGINAGDYIDKEDWDGFIDTLIKHLNQ